MACGKKEAVSSFMTESEAKELSEYVVEFVGSIVADQTVSEYEDCKAITDGAKSWESALEEMGGYQGITGTDVTLKEDKIVVLVSLDGAKRDAVTEIVLTKDAEANVQSFTVNVEYTLAEKMKNASLNTLLGMGTVFFVLILISLIITCMGLIPRIQKRMDAKKGTTDRTQESIDHVMEQISKMEEQEIRDLENRDPGGDSAGALINDQELVAIITAAICAFEGETPESGFVVRSIKKSVNNRWK